MPILAATALMLTLGMGIRQCFGLFVGPVTRDLGLRVADLTLAVSVQNLAWGVLQPVTGALVVRFGFRRVMVAGALLYVGGLAVTATAQGMPGILLGAGVLVGAGLACTASGLASATASRAVPAGARSMVLGAITGMGTLGALVAAPLAQSLTAEFGWRIGMLGLLGLAVAMVPAAWIAGRVDRVGVPPAATHEIAEARAGAALAAAFRRPAFVVMACAYFVCGMQLLFITTHLPSYLELCGMDPMLSAQALGIIAVFNLAGSLFFGWAGGRWPKLVLLGSIYVCRSWVLGWYFASPPTPGGTLVFAGLMGFLWLGVGPLVSGAVAEMFGLRWQAMIQGVAFMSHQLGSFLGAFGGGILFDLNGDYALAWRIGVGLGLAAGLVQVLAAVALPRPPQPVGA